MKGKIAGRIENDGIKNVKIKVPLKCLSIFWITLEMPLINCEINLILTWSNRCFIIDNPIVGQEPNLYVSVVTLSTQDNAKLLEQLKSSFKRAINWNKYEPKVTLEQRSRYLDFLIHASFRGVNRLCFII